jgi:signal transduction histidine kinase
MRKRLRSILVAFSISFVLMAGLAFFSMERFSTLIRYSNDVDHTHLVISRLYNIEGYIKDLDRGERGYMLTKDTVYSNRTYRVIDSIAPSLKVLRTLLDDNKVQQNNLVVLRSIIALRVHAIRENFEHVDADTTTNHSPSIYYDEGRKLMVDCVHKMRDMHNIENGLLAERYKNEQFYQTLTSNAFKYIIVFFFAVTILLFILMVRELKRRMQYQDELQTKVIDLRRSHAELEQIAYASSHDLQEPLRKIQVFSNRLVWLKKDTMDEETHNTMDRISAAAARMQDLIEELVNLTSLTKETQKANVNLSIPFKSAIDDLGNKIEGKHAVITYSEFPAAKGSIDQLKVLFKALLDNSIKFSREGQAPEINVTCDIVSGEELMENFRRLSHNKYHRITITDNGIGFENKFANKMFRIFQRLHNRESEYEGKGIGLAICQRIMTNHEGYILAYGHLEIGATFKLYFPVSEQ